MNNLLRKLFAQKTYHLAIIILSAIALAACSSDDAEMSDAEKYNIPAEYGKLAFNIVVPSVASDGTRAVTGEWLETTDSKELINDFTIYVCEGGKVVDIIAGILDTPAGKKERIVGEQVYTPGLHTFTFYAISNMTVAQAGMTDIGKDSTLTMDYFNNKGVVINTKNQKWNNKIPMTGYLAEQTVNITSGSFQDRNTGNQTLEIKMWRMMAKIELKIKNETAGKVRVKGVEIAHLNDGTAGISFFQRGNGQNQDQSTLLGNTDNHKNGELFVYGTPALSTYREEPTGGLFTLEAKNDGNSDENSYVIYVNETDMTTTALYNQYSLRFKLQRQQTGNPEAWYDEEIRLGITLPWQEGANGYKGYNVIRRNDWIKVPVNITPWELRAEGTPFVPIAGYPAVINNDEATNVTFATGGGVIIRPLLRNTADAVPTWLEISADERADFDFDTDVTFTEIDANGNAVAYGSAQSMMRMPFAQVGDDFIGELRYEPEYSGHKVTMMIKVTVDKGTANEHTQIFAYNIIRS